MKKNKTNVLCVIIGLAGLVEHRLVTDGRTDTRWW